MYKSAGMDTRTKRRMGRCQNGSQGSNTVLNIIN